MIQSIRLLVLSFIVFMVCNSCEKDDPIIPNSPELITTLVYTLTPINGGETVELQYIDSDGEGGMSGTIIGGKLQPNQVYTGNIAIFNQSVMPQIDITQEIEEEKDDHQFFYSSNISNLTFEYLDKDNNNLPVGIQSRITLGDIESTSGTLTVTLRHLPNKLGSGVADGDKTNAGGETDVEVTFPIDVE